MGEANERDPSGSHEITYEQVVSAARIVSEVCDVGMFTARGVVRAVVLDMGLSLAPPSGEPGRTTE